MNSKKAIRRRIAFLLPVLKSSLLQDRFYFNIITSCSPVVHVHNFIYLTTRINKLIKYLHEITLFVFVFITSHCLAYFS
jgi:transposase